MKQNLRVDSQSKAFERGMSFLLPAEVVRKELVVQPERQQTAVKERLL